MKYIPTEDVSGKTKLRLKINMQYYPYFFSARRYNRNSISLKFSLLKLGLSLEEQLRRLQEERTCKVCMDKEVSVVFIPCGHLVVCQECAPSLRKCPICRGIIKGTVRTFLS